MSFNRLVSLLVFTIVMAVAAQWLPPMLAQTTCSPAYPEICIPPPPPDLDCKDISFRNFRVLSPDPHRFDGDKDGIGCEQ